MSDNGHGLGDLAAALAKHYSPEPMSGCWIWTSATNRKGYGVWTMAGKWINATRASWLIHRGPIPTDLHVLHRCDTPPCVNPAHLFLGTAADNMADKVAKGRQAKGAGNAAHLYPERRPRGEKHGCAKLTTAIAHEIRLAVQRGGSIKGTARRFGISGRTVGRIARGVSWSNA